MNPKETEDVPRHVPRGKKQAPKTAEVVSIAPAAVVLENWMTTEEAAAYLRVSVQTIYWWRTRGEGPKAHKVGKRLLYLPEDLREFVLKRSA